MTELQIQKSYKLLAVVTLTASIAFVLIPNEQPLLEKFRSVIILNLALHLVYQFTSRIPKGLLDSFKSGNPKIEQLAGKLFRGFSILMMVFSIIGAILFLSSLLNNYQFGRLLLITVYIALFLGGYMTKLKMDRK